MILAWRPTSLTRLMERPFRPLSGGSLPEFLQPRSNKTAELQSVPAFRQNKRSMGAPLLRQSSLVVPPPPIGCFKLLRE